LVFDPTLACSRAHAQRSLAWHFPPSLPAGKFPAGRQDLLLSRTMISDSRRLTWVVSPATGLDLQPQTRAQPMTMLGRRSAAGTRGAQDRPPAPAGLVMASTATSRAARTMAASGSRSRAGPLVVRTAKRSALRWCA